MLPKTRASLDVRRAERAFEGAPELPAPGDVLAYVPDLPDASKHLLAYARKVRGRSLWIWFWPADESVQLVALTSVPPGSGG